MSEANHRRCGACKEVGHTSGSCPYKILRTEFVYKNVISVIKCFPITHYAGSIHGIIKGMLIESVNIFYEHLLPLLQEREERWLNIPRISSHSSTTKTGKILRIIELFEESYEYIVNSVSQREFDDFYQSLAYENPYVRQPIFTASTARHFTWNLFETGRFGRPHSSVIGHVPYQLRRVLEHGSVINLTNVPVQRRQRRTDCIKMVTKVCHFIPKETECPICFDCMEGNAVKLDCNHTICSGCLAMSIKATKKTPDCCLCRSKSKTFHFRNKCALEEFKNLVC